MGLIIQGLRQNRRIGLGPASRVTLRSLTIGLVLGLSVELLCAESVDVKYRGFVGLEAFTCTDVSRSGFIRRVCYDRKNQYMLIKLNARYYHYCELPSAVLDQFLEAQRCWLRSEGTFIAHQLVFLGNPAQRIRFGL
jgi:hypothetical protein